MEWNITHIDETDSTNRWLRDAEELHKRDGSFCVVADYQTAGRGCGTNSWESERGQNLTFSLLIHPEEVPANQQFHITEAVSVALCQTEVVNDGDHSMAGLLIPRLNQGKDLLLVL